MKYKVGDKVRVKSLDWYNENKDEFGNVGYFTSKMTQFCGQIVIVSEKTSHFYRMENIDFFLWTDEMIECKVEEEAKFGTASNPTGIKSNANCLTRERVDELATKIDKELPSGNPYEWECPEGYQFVDDGGNVINTNKIVLEKKKKEYPKTYEECAKIFNEFTGSDCNLKGCIGYMSAQLTALQKLLICRAVYWKIAGDEMGLKKPWEPDWNNVLDKYCIYFVSGHTWSKECQTRQCPFAFPTPEMRNAFYENFKEEIEKCKELL